MSDSAVLWLNFHISYSFSSYLEKIWGKGRKVREKHFALCCGIAHGQSHPKQAAAPGRSLALHNHATAYLSTKLVWKANIFHFLFLSNPFSFCDRTAVRKFVQNRYFAILLCEPSPQLDFNKQNQSRIFFFPTKSALNSMLFSQKCWSCSLPSVRLTPSPTKQLLTFKAFSASAMSALIPSAASSNLSICSWSRNSLYTTGATLFSHIQYIKLFWSKTDEFSENFHREGGSFSIQKFVLQILDLLYRAFSDVFWRKKLQHNFRKLGGGMSKAIWIFFWKFIRFGSLTRPLWWTEKMQTCIT